MSPTSLQPIFATVRRLLTVLAAVLLLVASPPSAARDASSSADLRCPMRLAQMTVADGVPAGWIVHAPPGELHLQRATFYDGDPVGLATLPPDATHRSGLTETSTWHFGAGDSARVWLACLYRDATTVVARPLPPGLQQCTTVLRLTALGEPSEPVSVACR